jgi:ribosomal protein L11 methyltransferase
VSETLYVGPPDRADQVPPGANFIRIRSRGAFGDAAHPTTRGCLRLLASVVAAGDRLLDVGTGSGVLAIGSALLGAAEVEAVEADPVACAAARENITLNRTEDRVNLCCRRLTPDMVASNRLFGLPFDGIVANVEPDVHRALLPSLVEALRPLGWLVASGIPDSDLGEVLALAETRGLELAAEDRDEGWWSGRFTRGG